jgi:tetratricopeptide (TPR) repeat protein
MSAPLQHIDTSDSIMAMMKDAESNSRWSEIIKLGTALSEVLWYTSRKKLRIDVGHIVSVAARQLNDTEALARAQIEDIGNTMLGLRDVEQGISYIKQGIKVAEDNNHTFLVSRGYRNLANCYSYKSETSRATEALKKAEAAAAQLPAGEKKLEALGAIEYARCKVRQSDGDYQGAIAALDRALLYYADLANQFPATRRDNKDRLVKIHREKGAIYLRMNKADSRDLAYESLQAGLQLAQETQNYDNEVRCCCLMARILLDRDAVPAAEGIMNIAAKSISNLEMPSIIEEYNQINRRIINAKQVAS